MSLNPSLPDFTSRAIAALNAGQDVATDKAVAYRAQVCRSVSYLVDVVRADGGIGRTYRFPSAPLAVAFLRSL